MRMPSVGYQKGNDTVKRQHLIGNLIEFHAPIQLIQE
jgi:hypothetical protein